MKRGSLFLVSTLLGSMTVVVRADPTDDAMVAAMKLSGAISYSWTTKISQKSQPLEIRGKTSADGYSLLTFVGYSAGGVASSSAKLGGGINTVFRGDSKYVVENNGSWVIPSDTSAPAPQAEPANRNPSGSNAPSGSRAKRSRGAGIGTGATSPRRSPSGNEADVPASPVGPRIPPGVNLPHEELAIVASNFSEMKVENSIASGKLTEWGADLLLEPPGWMQSPPDKAAGTFRLWIKDGMVTKYELKLTAETGPGGAVVKGGLAETITVEVTDVGTTDVKVPPGARLKLGV